MLINEDNGYISVYALLLEIEQFGIIDNCHQMNCNMPETLFEIFLCHY